jgi:hypothetical protein
MKLDPTFGYSVAFNHKGLISEEQFAASPYEGSIPGYVKGYNVTWNNLAANGQTSNPNPPTSNSISPYQSNIIGFFM